MPKVKIRAKRVITLPDDKKTRLDIGVHSIEKSVYDHWFIQGQVAIGDVTLVGKHTDELSVLPKSNAIKQLQPVTTPKEALTQLTKANEEEIENKNLKFNEEETEGEKETKLNLKRVERVTRNK